MAFDAKQVAIEVRNLITEASPASVGIEVPRISAVIPTALEVWSRKMFEDPSMRKFFDEEVNVTITSGVADLTSWVDGTSNRMYLPDLLKQTVYLATGETCIWVGQRQQLSHDRVGHDKDTVALFLDGYTIRSRNVDGSLTSLTGTTLDVTVPTYPDDVTEIPVTLQKGFIDFMAEYVRAEFGLTTSGHVVVDN
jgi:hypothetical protein